MVDQDSFFGTTSVPSGKAKYTWILQGIDVLINNHPNGIQSSTFILQQTESGRFWNCYLKYTIDAGFALFLENRKADFIRTTIIYEICLGNPAGPMNYKHNGSTPMEFHGCYNYKSSEIILPMKSDELLKYREESENCGNGLVRVCVDVEVEGPPLSVNETDLWAKFNSSPLTLNMAKLFNDTTFADVTVRCDNKTFSAHKLILGQNSVFSSMLKSPMKEGLTSEIVISDVDPSVLELFLKSLYGLPIEVPSEPAQVIQLLDSAEKYDLQGLKWTCLKQMWNSLSYSTAAEFTIAVFKYSENEEVRKYFRSFCQQRMKTLVKDEKFKQLYKDCLEAFV